MKKLMIGLLTMAGVFANAESSVWKVSKGSSVLYVGATCHLLREADFPLPPEFDKAFKAASLTVFETDIGKLQDPAMQQEVLKRTMYTDGSTVEKHLSPASYRLIQAYCSSNNLPLEALNRFKPSMLMVTISAMELMKLGATQQGVDLFYHKQSKKEGKQIEGLETVVEQLDYIVSMADGHEDDFVRYSMEDLGKLKETFDTLVAAWRKGDDEKIEALMVNDLKSRLPSLYKTIITDRNNRWVPKIEAYLKTPQSEFILVGAGHLGGPEGVLAALRKKGYQVQKL
jgi:uncharacterized protein YbaP (TraB family)